MVKCWISDAMGAIHAPAVEDYFGHFGHLDGTEVNKLLHTRFHVVPKLELTTGATAGVAIDDTSKNTALRIVMYYNTIYAIFLLSYFDLKTVH